MAGKNRHALVLFSGGIDSTACLYYYLSEKFNVECIFVDYGQKSKKYELDSARKIAEYYNVPLKELRFCNSKNFHSGEIIGRNSFLIISTIMNVDNYCGILAMGLHEGTPYYDCSELFVNTMNNLLKGYLNGKILLDTPFIKWNKSMIVDYCIDKGIPLDLTYSCENGTNPPCGTCLSCLDRKELNVSKKNVTKIERMG